jgi:predicted acetyltransferase
VEGWAISSVSVSPTHRRRGIARALLEAELRTAVAHGTAIAMLTVSDSRIYGRFGFAPAASAATWVIDTRRVTWTGPVPDGRVEFITAEEYLADATALHEATLDVQPGEVAMWPGRWQQRVGTFSEDSSLAGKTRAVRYVDPSGTTRGVAVYRIDENGDDFTAHDLHVVHLWAPDADAHAALWRFLLEYDLVTTVHAELLRPDDPLRWSIGDWRAATVTVWDHQYLRILDVPAAFEARRYDADGVLALRVADPYGFTEGTWLLRVADGAGRVERIDQVDAGVPVLAGDAAALSALYLGGVRALDLVQAGRVVEETPGSARAVDAVLHSLVEPSLGGWY